MNTPLYTPDPEINLDAFDNAEIDNNSLALLEKGADGQRYVLIGWPIEGVLVLRFKVGLPSNASDEIVKAAEAKFGQENVVQSEKHKTGIVHQKGKLQVMRDKQDVLHTKTIKGHKIRIADELRFGGSFTKKIQPNGSVKLLFINRSGVCNEQNYWVDPLAKAAFYLHVLGENPLDRNYRQLYHLRRSAPTNIMNRATQSITNTLNHMGATQYSIHENSEAEYGNGMYEQAWGRLSREEAINYVKHNLLLLAKGKTLPDGSHKFLHMNDIRIIVGVAHDEGILQDIRDDEGMSLLHIVAQRGNQWMLEALLDKDINLDLTNKEGQSALDLALKNNQHDSVKQLIYKGAKLGQTHYDKLKAIGHSATSLLMEEKDSLIVTLIGMLLYGRSQLHQDEEALTLLQLATKKNNIQIINTLIEAGADLNAQNESGQTALDIAIHQKNESVIMALLKAGAHLTGLKGLPFNFHTRALFFNDEKPAPPLKAYMDSILQSAQNPSGQFFAKDRSKDPRIAVAMKLYLILRDAKGVTLDDKEIKTIQTAGPDLESAIAASLGDPSIPERHKIALCAAIGKPDMIKNLEFKSPSSRTKS